MKQILFIAFLFMSFCADAQLSTNQKKQVTTMIATATTPLNTEIAKLKIEKSIDSLRIAVLMDSLKKYRPIVPEWPFFIVKPGPLADTLKVNKIFILP